MKFRIYRGVFILIILLICGYVFLLMRNTDTEPVKVYKTDIEPTYKASNKLSETNESEQGKVILSNGEHINDRTTVTFTAKHINGYLEQSTKIKGFTKDKAILIAVENKIDSMTATIIGAIPMPIDASIRALIESKTDDPIARSVIKKTLTSKGKGHTGFTVGITVEDDSRETGQSKEIEDFPVGRSIVIGFHNKDDPTMKLSIASFMMPIDTIRALTDKMEYDR